MPLYFELDGTFPNHEANPLEPENLRDLQRAVVEHGADLGLAFDGDADRCFVIDERGEPVSPSAITALVATREIAKEAGRRIDAGDVSIVHNVITSAAVAEIIAERGARPVRTRVGHSFIKGEMARTRRVFGGEHSAHYYFRDFWYADTGMLAAMHVLAALGEQDGTAVATSSRSSSRYVASRRDQLHGRRTPPRPPPPYASGPRAQDGRRSTSSTGSTVTHQGEPMWWFNLRASNTEPLLRLNVEAADEPTMERVRDEVLAHRPGDAPMTEHTRRPDRQTSAPRIEPWLREILRCPQCQGRARRRHRPGRGPELQCTSPSAALAYRVDDGIPVLLVDEARSRTR